MALRRGQVTQPQSRVHSGLFSGGPGGRQRWVLLCPHHKPRCRAQRPPWGGRLRHRRGPLCLALGQGLAQPAQTDWRVHSPEALGAEGLGAKPFTSLSLSIPHVQIWIISYLAEGFWEMLKSENRSGTRPSAGTEQGLRGGPFPPRPLPFLLMLSLWTWDKLPGGILQVDTAFLQSRSLMT